MNWIYNLSLILLLAGSCTTSNTNESNLNILPNDSLLCSNYYSSYLAKEIKLVVPYVILFSKKACFSCFIGYFDILFPKMKKNNFTLYSSQSNNDSIQKYFNLNKEVLKVEPKESNFDEQYFMRHELVVLKIDTLKNEVIEFIPIKANGINELQFD